MRMTSWRYTTPKTVTPVSHPRRSQVLGISLGSDNGDYVNGAPLDYTGIILTPAFATSEPIAR